MKTKIGIGRYVITKCKNSVYIVSQNDEGHNLLKRK